MNLDQVNSRTTFFSSADTTQYLPADRLISLNNANDYVHLLILAAQDGDDFDDKNYTTEFPILRTGMVADQADYSLPTELLMEKRVVFSYDGGSNKYKAEPFDIAQSGVDLSHLTFEQTAPMYDISSNSIKVYPTPSSDSDNGIEIWISREMYVFTAADVSTGTKTIGIDRPVHDLIPAIMALDWVAYKEPNNVSKINSLEKRIAKLEITLKRHYSNKNQDSNITAKAGYVNYE